MWVFKHHQDIHCLAQQLWSHHTSEPCRRKACLLYIHVFMSQSSSSIIVAWTCLNMSFRYKSYGRGISRSSERGKWYPCNFWEIKLYGYPTWPKGHVYVSDYSGNRVQRLLLIMIGVMHYFWGQVSVIQDVLVILSPLSCWACLCIYYYLQRDIFSELKTWVFC
jgi:hypothetical protein